MTNALYDKARKKFLDGNIAYLTNDIKVALVDSALYTPDMATDEFLDDIPSGAIIATSGNLANKSSTDGIADADDVVFSTVTGDQSEFLVIYKDTTTASTSPLIALIDTATGLPVTPNGGDITIEWDSGDNKIFKL
jgi:hypothetical protein